MENLVGQSIGGRYHVIEQLGQGGMAVVYKAFDTRLEREVALKLIRTESFAPSVAGQMLKRFEREGKSLARMMHPNIVPIHDYGEHNGSPYLVMSYIAGGTLKDFSGRVMPYAQAASLLAPVARALAYAHELNIIHRDVKPSNVLITVKGQPMLSDFGVAKILESEDGGTLTGTGVGIGTPEYMAPEQWVNKVVPQTDTYALGVVFYELVTGHKPYTADTPAAILIKQVNDPLPRPKKYVPGLPDEVEKIIFKAMTKNPGERYARIDDFAAALEKLAARADTVLPLKPAPAVAGLVPEMPGEKITEKYPRPKPVAPRHEEQPAAAVGSKRNRVPPWVYALTGVVTLGLLAALVVFSLWLGGIFRPRGASTAGLAAVTPEMAEGGQEAGPGEMIVPAGGSTQTWLDGMVGVFVPEGDYEMGSNTGDNNERPAHIVYLDGFYIDRTEVTNGMYRQCVQAGACSLPQYNGSYSRESYFGNSQYWDYPVISVTWQQAGDYCTWAGRRLPTEAEWEKAARGTSGRIYPWKDEFKCDNGNFDDETQQDMYVVPGGPDCDGYADTAPVGSYPSGASPYGALDMAGNISEWVADWFSADYYSQSPRDNPAGPASGNYRVLRGGSWSLGMWEARSTHRDPRTPDQAYLNGGFRCAYGISQ